MVIMERFAHQPPVVREIFQKQLDVAVAQFGLVYPCLLKDRPVDLYKLYCLVSEVKLKTNGDYSYTDNVEEWRRIAEEMGYMGDINAIVLFKIYNRYIAEGYEKSSSHLSGVPFTKKKSLNSNLVDRASSPNTRPSTPGSDVEMPRQKRVYRKRKNKDKPTLPPSIASAITPVRLNPMRYSVTPVRYNFQNNKTFSTCTRAASPKVGGSWGRGASQAGGSRGASPARGSRGATPPVMMRNVEVFDRTAKFIDKTSAVQVMTSQAEEEEDQLPEGCVLEGKGADTYIVDDGVLPKPAGEPEKYDVNPVIRQLECGLPHEVQFGLNMLLWMTKSWPLPLPKYPRLLSVLLANTGVPEPSSVEFWEDDGMREFWAECQQESHFFNTGCKSQRTRAIQISVIFGNLCHIESNAKILLESDSFQQYLIQSLNSSCVPIRNSGVEILSLLANQVELEHAVEFSKHVFGKLPSYLTSSDRFLIVSGLEVITNLCGTSSNHVFLIDNLSAEQYSQLCLLLLVPDVQLLHSTLEALYSLTSIGLHPCEQLLNKSRLISTLVDLFSCSAERLNHTGIRVLRYVERKPKVEEKPAITAMKIPAETPAPEMKSRPRPVVHHQVQPPINPEEVKKPVTFAESWMKRSLQFSQGSILLKCAVYNKYVKAVNEAAPHGHSPDILSPAELFTLLSNTFPGSFRQKISVGATMKFVVKNMDWRRNPIDIVPSSTVNSSQPVFMKIKSIAPKTETPRPDTPITQFTTPKPATVVESTEVVETTSSKVKINPSTLSDLADDAFKFVSEKKAGSDEEMRSSDEEWEAVRKKKRGRKKKREAEIEEEEMVVAEIIVEELDASDPKIIEECEDMEGRIVAEEKDFPSSPKPARVIKTYTLKRGPSSESLPVKPNNAFTRFNQPQPREYSQYKKTLMLDLSTTPEKKQRTEMNAARANFNKHSSFDSGPSSPTFDKQNDGGTSPTFDRCASPVFNCSEPRTKKRRPSDEQPGSPTFDKAGSPTFDRAGSPTFDKAGSPTFDKGGSPTFEKSASPTFEKSALPTFDKTGSPTFEKSASPTFDKAGSPTFDKAGSPTFDKTGSPTFEKSASPTFGKPASSPTFDMAGSQTIDKSASPTFDKSASPTFDKFVSQNKAKSAMSDKVMTNNVHSIPKPLGCKPTKSGSETTPMEVMDHLNSVSGALLDDPSCTFSPLPNFEPDNSIFDRNSDNSAGKSDKLKIDNDIFVSEAEVDTFAPRMSSPIKSYQNNTSNMNSCSQMSSNTSSPRKAVFSPESKKPVLKTVVSNHQSGDQMTAVSLIPISISGQLNSRVVPQISSAVQTMAPDPSTPNSCHNTVRLAKISPQKSNPQFMSQQIQVLVPSQQQNVMVVNQSPGSSQQMYVVPQNPAPQQRLLVASPPNSATQQVLVLPHNQHPNSQQVLLAPSNQGQTQQVFVSQSQQPSTISGQPIFIATSGQNSGQPIIIAQQNQPAPTGTQVLLTSQNQTSPGQQFILAPQQPTNTGQILLTPGQSAGPQPVFISQQSACNGPVIVQTPNPQVSGQILIAPQGQTTPGQMIISPQNNTRVLVLPHSQPTNNSVLVTPQPNSGMQHLVSNNQTSSPSGQVLQTPLFLNSNPVIISSQTGSPTKQILVPLSTSSFSSARFSNVTSRDSAASSSAMTSVTTSCTTVYSEPVVCTAPGRQTYTLSPSKLPVMSPIKVTHISPIKFMSNGAGGTVALVAGNQQRVGSTGTMTTQSPNHIGGKRPLTRIAPRPGPAPSTATTFFVPSSISSTPTPITGADSSEKNAEPTPNPTTTDTSDRKRKLVLPPSPHPYPCHWRNCHRGFDKEIELQNHLLSEHVPASPSACQWLTCCENPGSRSRYSLVFHLKNIHARAPLLTHIPSSSYTREKVRLLLSKTLPWTDPRETPITKCLHLLIALILRNLVYFAPELVGEIASFETVLASIAMSSQEAGRVLADVLALTSGITADSEEGVFITHLPPFR